MPESTSSGDSGTTSTQLSYAGSAGSTRASRPRGASRSVLQVEQAVRADPGVRAGVHADLHLRTAARRRRARSAIQTSSRGAVPADAVTSSQRPSRDTEHVVVVRRVEAGAVHLDVGGRVGADPVPPHPPVELLLAGRHRVRRQPPHVVELLAAGQPGDGGVAAAVDRAVQPLAGGDVEDVEPGLLVAAGGQLVGEPVALDGSAPRRPASWCRPGPARSGRPAPARCRPARATSSASCSWPGSRRVKKRRSPRQDGARTLPVRCSSVSRSVSRSRPGRASRAGRASSSCGLPTRPRCAGRRGPPASGTGRPPGCPCSCSTRSSRSAAG